VPVKNGWTGGQYSLFRAAFGLYLALHFTHLIPWGAELFSNVGALSQSTLSPLARLFPNVLVLFDAPWQVSALLGAAAASSLLFAVGLLDRSAAIFLWYVSACLLGRNPLIANPGIPYVGWLLLAHALLPREPYGSWGARGRSDPDGGWTMPQPILRAAWILMAFGYSYGGVTKLGSRSWIDGTAIRYVLENPFARPGIVRDLLVSLPDPLLRIATWGTLGLELLFVPLALFRRVRPLLWSALLAMHIVLVVLIDFTDLSLAMIMLHLFTFDPAWLQPRPPQRSETLFYDGGCGLCHRAVRFALAEDRSAGLRFAPLQGEAFRAAVPTERRGLLPDSLVLQTEEGALLTRSEAVVRMLLRFGGVWRLFGRLLRAVPTTMRDAAYDLVARLRHRLFARPAEACPVIPARLRDRFILS
jgi:predicted DCC family thiol-disulfide oxidoreductase YuxK